MSDTQETDTLHTERKGSHMTERGTIEGIVEHPLVRLLMNYDNCPDDAVDAAAALVGKLVEAHNAAGDDWETWIKTRSVDWFDEVAGLLKPFETNTKDQERTEPLVSDCSKINQPPNH